MPPSLASIAAVLESSWTLEALQLGRYFSREELSAMLARAAGIPTEGGTYANHNDH